MNRSHDKIPEEEWDCVLKVSIRSLCLLLSDTRGRLTGTECEYKNSWARRRWVSSCNCLFSVIFLISRAAPSMSFRARA